MKNRLKVLRAERDWSQQDLATRLEVSRQSVNAIETGRYDPVAAACLPHRRCLWAGDRGYLPARRIGASAIDTAPSIPDHRASGIEGVFAHHARVAPERRRRQRLRVRGQLAGFREDRAAQSAAHHRHLGRLPFLGNHTRAPLPVVAQRFVDENLEWAGTGMELFIGFVMVFVLFGIPYFGLSFVAQALVARGYESLGIALSAVAALAIFYLWASRVSARCAIACRGRAGAASAVAATATASFSACPTCGRPPSAGCRWACCCHGR